MSKETISKIIKDNVQIADDIFETIDLKLEDNIFSIKKKTTTAKRNRSVKISLDYKEMIRLLAFLELTHYETE